MPTAGAAIAFWEEAECRRGSDGKCEWDDSYLQYGLKWDEEWPEEGTFDGRPGFQVYDVEAYVEQGELYLAILWRSDIGNTRAFRGFTFDELQENTTMRMEGGRFDVRDIECILTLGPEGVEEDCFGVWRSVSTLTLREPVITRYTGLRSFQNQPEQVAEAADIEVVQLARDVEQSAPGDASIPASVVVLSYPGTATLAGEDLLRNRFEHTVYPPREPEDPCETAIRACSPAQSAGPGDFLDPSFVHYEASTFDCQFHAMNQMCDYRLVDFEVPGPWTALYSPGRACDWLQIGGPVSSVGESFEYLSEKHLDLNSVDNWPEEPVFHVDGRRDCSRERLVMRDLEVLSVPVLRRVRGGYSRICAKLTPRDGSGPSKGNNASKAASESPFFSTTFFDFTPTSCIDLANGPLHGDGSSGPPGG